MADLGNGYESVEAARCFVLRFWRNGLPHDLRPTYPFDPTKPGDRKRAFHALLARCKELNREAAAQGRPVDLTYLCGGRT